ncbi:MAG: hypothetical protein GY898_19050 [Proteobacteria bacterium]|nr:hypothetical protein [Pseudomonadota bacterium]
MTVPFANAFTPRASNWPRETSTLEVVNIAPVPTVVETLPAPPSEAVTLPPPSDGFEPYVAGPEPDATMPPADAQVTLPPPPKVVPPRRRRRRWPKTVGMDNAGYGSDPVVQYQLAEEMPEDSGGVEIDLNLGSASTNLALQPRLYTDSTPAALVPPPEPAPAPAEPAASLWLQASETAIMDRPAPAPSAHGPAPMTPPLSAAEQTLPPGRPRRPVRSRPGRKRTAKSKTGRRSRGGRSRSRWTRGSGWVVRQPEGRRGPRRPADAETTSSGLMRRWGVNEWLDRSNVLKGLAIGLAVLVLMFTFKMFKRAWAARSRRGASRPGGRG